MDLVGVLSVFIGIGFFTYLYQYFNGLTVTGLSRDVPWGFYIAQFTFMVGVAASAVMVVLPYYLHNYKTFGKITVIGEFVAISSVLVCMLFIFVDMGGPSRVQNVILYPSPNSLMFWDMSVLSGYLLLNVVITRVTFSAEKKQIAPPKWIKPIIILSIPWAVSIHTVTAFLYAGLGARSFWMTAIMAPRFLASAFAAGPSLLIILVMILRRFTKFDAGSEPIKKLSVIVTYAMCANVFFVAMEFFTGLYSNIPEHMHHFHYLYFGMDGQTGLVPFAWTSAVLTLVALGILLVPSLRNNEKVLLPTCVMVIVGLWIDKGIDLVITGFVPSPLGHVNEYFPTLPEVLIALGIYSLGIAALTVFNKIAVTVRENAA